MNGRGIPQSLLVEAALVALRAFLSVLIRR